ncbi:hypothetical protein GCU67_20740 [Modestobacter muralis]|uniref:Uncharacterized protein n=1 Tax=Modestobacter muralis TaxID=1608614 RepID=A0A6P0HCM5_9ACTN|nr:hypothetical protein [Modestobacter muralis]NEN53492.1 hypothetical protein [Modestobacter muralis]
MCRAVTCRTCGLATWSGCGQHVDRVLAGVPSAQRCPGHDPAPASAPAPTGGGRLRRLLHRS